MAKGEEREAVARRVKADKKESGRARGPPSTRSASSAPGDQRPRALVLDAAGDTLPEVPPDDEGSVRESLLSSLSSSSASSTGGMSHALSLRL